MGYIKREIRKKSKKEGSKSAARKKAEEWYKDAIKRRKNRSVEKTTNPFFPGKIYVFEYLDPVTPNLEWWDMNPVVLSLNPTDANDLGVNLNLLPIAVKEQLLDDLYTALEPMIEREKNGKALDEGPLNITYEGMKFYLKKYGYDFAIRQYKRHVKKNQAVVSYDNWADIALCDFIELNGKTLWDLRREFGKWINK